MLQYDSKHLVAEMFTKTVSRGQSTSATEDNLLGSGSPVTTTTCGSFPLRLRIKFKASDREFWERSLRIVSLQETLA